MVKLNAPLMSFDASGTVANAVTFAKWKGRPYARVRVVPANPKTPKQLGIRAAVKFLGQQWASLDATAQSSWETLAAQSNVSPFNAFVGKNAYDWRSQLYPTKTYPAARSSTAPTIPTIAISAGTRQVTIAIMAGTTKPSWGYSIHRSNETGLTPSWTNCVAFVACDAGGNASYIDTPLPAGTYHYIAKPFNIDGKDGTPSSQETATVT